MVPALVAHNLGRAEVRTALREELAAAVAELSTHTLGELLDELGLRAAVGDAVRAHGLPLARAFVASAEYSTVGRDS